MVRTLQEVLPSFLRELIDSALSNGANYNSTGLKKLQILCEELELKQKERLKCH